MHKLLFTFSIGILALWIGGCGSQPSEEEATSTPSPDASPSPTATAPVDPSKTAEKAPNGTQPPFKEPLVEEKADVASQAGLIQSTKAEERLIQLQGGANRNQSVAAAPAATTARPASQRVDDPFAVLPPIVVENTPDPLEGGANKLPELEARDVPDLPDVPRPNIPVVTIAAAIKPQETQAAQPNKAAIPELPEIPLQGRPRQWQSATARNQPQGRVPGAPFSPQLPAQGRAPAVARVPTLPVAPKAGVPELPQIPIDGTPTAWRDPSIPLAVGPSSTSPLGVPAAPPPPSTDIALGVEVTGVLQVGSETRVILKAPTEPTSRYVSVGQRVANGEVLVKRVKFDTGGEPIVILEQNGVEIAKIVGETSPSMEQPLNTMILSRSLQ